MPTTPARKVSVWAVPTLVIAIAVALIAIVIVVQRGASASGDEAVRDSSVYTGADREGLAVLERRIDGDPQALGPIDAPIALIVYSDYQCPYCARWTSDTLPEMATYADAGDLRIEWRDLNVFGPVSERAARAAHAAGEQGHYWAFHNALFADGEHRGERGLTEEALIELAVEMKLDSARFRADMNSHAARSTTAINAEEGLSIGLTSTPAFILDGQPMIGAQPTSVFVDAVEAALASRG